MAGEAGEYDIVYSLPKEGRYILSIFNLLHRNQRSFVKGIHLRDGNESLPFINNVAQKVNIVIFQVQDVDPSIWL